MPHDAAAAIFDNPRAGLAWGAIHGNSRAVRVEGGYRLTGTWSFASGSRHTTWIGAHSATQNRDGTPHIRYGKPDAAASCSSARKPRSSTPARAGIARHRQRHVFRRRSVHPDAHAPDREVPDGAEPGPIYTFHSTPLYAIGFCGVTLGLARRMLELYTALARSRHSRASVNAMANNHAVQREIALLEAKLSAARAFLHEAVTNAWNAAVAGDLDVDQRMRLRLATTYGMNQATDVSIACYRGAGTAAIMNSAPFERRFRDAMSASQHMQAMLPLIEMVGRRHYRHRKQRRAIRLIKAQNRRTTTMPIIDLQVHAYERDHPGRPWVGTLTGPKEMTGDQMVAAMDAVGVDGAILVSPFSMYRYDASYALSVYAAHPTKFRLVKPVDPNDPAVADTIADWAGTKGTVGIRIMFRDGVSTDPADPGINRVLAAAAKHGLALNCMITGNGRIRRPVSPRAIPTREW